MVVRTIIYRLYPSHTCEKALISNLESCRLLYNKILEVCRETHENGGKYPGKYGMYGIIKHNRSEIEGLKNVYSQVQQDVGNRVDRAFQNFFRGCKSGEKRGYPRFKGNGRYDSFTYTQSGFRFEGNRLVLSKIGRIRFRNHAGIRGDIKTCTIKRSSTGKWYACVSYENEFFENDSISLEEKPASVGIDLGIGKLATLSDGTVYNNPKFYERDMKRISKISRKMSRHEKGSGMWLKYKRHLDHAYKRIRFRRKSHLNNISREIVERYDLIGLEDLDIRRMMENAPNNGLARSIGSVSWNILAKMISYKAEDAGRKVVFVDPRNTSQRCSRCGETVNKDLSVRQHVCPHCGLDIDRDINASMNIHGLSVRTDVSRELSI